MSAQKTAPLEERAAAEIVSRITGCEAHVLDTGGHQQADFILMEHGRAVGVLEVTTATARRWTSFYSALNQNKRSFFDARLNHNWAVFIGDAFIPRKYTKKITGALIVLEASGISAVDVAHDMIGVEAEPMPKEMLELGVREAATFGGETGNAGGWVRTGVTPRSGPVGGESVTVTMEGLIHEQGNLKKALSGSGPRHELFAWLNPPVPAAVSMVVMSEPPFSEGVALLRSPNLPVGVTCVWAATFSNDPTRRASALWRSDGGPWQLLSPPTHAPVA